ncbi:thioredoxin family protein [Luteolibacter sp. GHJ8]|uniref:Thioredoxin family protein n=1 Tax=Luteolibacter rhizosphaerae TaxID=2989719 RepID=A0ABT3G0P6_9BACT|nr:thioredoxin family protein [Luteolibacter rhizosphaerae]MCW1912800.1 thioredoxin family protein [Luteolibacter rhizosphaerae]
MRLRHLFLIPALLSSTFAAGEDWTADYEAAKKRAAAEGKDLLIDFTGSDWCAWCIKLRKEVFEQPGFAPAKDKFVLLELDYPKDESRVSEAVATQNAALIKKYPIKGYPTILLCDASGKPFAATGYQPGGPDKYLPHLDTLLAKKSARDQAIASASSKDGVEKARLLIGALEGMGLDNSMLVSNYPELAAEIKAADPADATGFTARQGNEEAFATFMAKLGELRSKQDLEGAMKHVETTLADGTIKGELRQQVYGHAAGTLASAGKKDEAIAILKRAIAESPDGPRTKELSDFIAILEREKAGLPPK